MIEFSCCYCYKWVPKKDFETHMRDHTLQGDDLGTIKTPDSWRDFVRRFTPLGLCQLRGEDE